MVLKSQRREEKIRRKSNFDSTTPSAKRADRREKLPILELYQYTREMLENNTVKPNKIPIKTPLKYSTYPIPSREYLIDCQKKKKKIG